MFLTKVFLMPYMAARLLQDPPEAAVSLSKGPLAKLFGLIGLGVGLLAMVWICLVQPDLGGFPERATYFTEQVAKNRVTLAFCVDLVLFYIFQVWLMGAIIQAGDKTRGLRFVPFWGLAIWLIV